MKLLYVAFAFILVPGDFFHRVALDDVALFDVVVVFDADTALITLCDFLGVVLVSLEGRDLAFVDDDTVTHQSDGLVADDLAVCNVRAADDAHVRHLEGLSDLDCSQYDFLVFRIEHTLHRVLRCMF